MNHRLFIVFCYLLAVAFTAVDGDRVNPIPGYPQSFQQKMYSGYLKTSASTRKLHYLFLESSSKEANVPLTLWLNGGPGCSSLLGFLQEIGPYFLEEGVMYKQGDDLIENPYSWNRESHLLFLESPAGVGYSINTDANFSHTDPSTADDNMDALLDFFTKYSQYSSNVFLIAGQSYAGKYIPDLAKRIDQYNTKGTGKAVNLKGILVGNGVMSFNGGTLEENTIQYIVDHEFIDPDLLPYYRGSCLVDPASAGCRYFMIRYRQNVDEINPYNVYSYCYYNDSFMADSSQNQNNNRQTQASILKNIFSNNGSYKSESAGNNGAPCAYFDGMLEYFNIHSKDYHSQTERWNGPCAENITSKYSISLRGSIDQYRYLLDRLDKYHIILYNGDWDSVVPFSDTVQNIQKLNLIPTDIYKSFFAEGQHAGWTQLYGGLLFVRMKGASHQVPQSKRAEAYELFNMVIQSLGGELIAGYE